MKTLSRLETWWNYGCQKGKSIMGTEKGSITQLKLVKTLFGIKLWTGERVWALGWSSLATLCPLLRCQPLLKSSSVSGHQHRHKPAVKNIMDCIMCFFSLRKTNETLIGGYKANEDDSIVITKSDQHTMFFSSKSEVSTNQWPVYMTTSAVGNQYNQ